MIYILALLADWANGIFALLLAAYVTDTEVLWWYVPIALVISHLPDIDAVPELLRRGKVAASAEHPTDHRTLLHYPILSVPLGVLVVYVFGFWGWVVCFAIILHLLNDLYGTGWGIPLFWPLTKRRYKLFGRRVNRLKPILNEQAASISESEEELRAVVSWDEDELQEHIQQWGMDDWVERVYLHVNWISVTEYSLFIFACVLVFFYFF